MKAIFERRSIRKYDPSKEVTKEQIEGLLKAAMFAPSACNTRAWDFIVVTDKAVKEKLAAVHPYAKMLTTASCAIIVCALPKRQSEINIAVGYFPQDCAAVTMNILLEATDTGLGSCWCGVYPKEDRIKELREIFSLPEEVIPFNIIAIGYPSEKPEARGRFEPEKVHYNKW